MIRISSQLLVSAPKDRVSAYLRDLRHIPEYDKKVSEVVVLRQDRESAEVAAVGTFLGRKWKDTVTILFSKDGGYECSVNVGRLTTMKSVYHLSPVTGGTLLGHEEVYDVSVLLKPVLLAARGWFRQALEAEMRVIKEGAQAVDRQLKLKEIDSLV
ncbi:MAG: SRPBCC family protein [Elusimicrobiota bacterium]|jgi:hypothetical protein